MGGRVGRELLLGREGRREMARNKLAQREIHSYVPNVSLVHSHTNARDHFFLNLERTTTNLYIDIQKHDLVSYISRLNMHRNLLLNVL